MLNSVSNLIKNIGLGSRSATGQQNHIQTTNQITGSRRWWALAAVLVTMFFSSLDQTIISTAMPVIIGELQGLSLYAWTFTAYMLTSAVTVPIYGKLSDVYGRKPFYIAGLLFFMIGSMLCGLVVSMPQLILARGLQGLGAGALLSMPRATIGDIFNPRERGRWMGIVASVFGLSSIIGPVMGGWITDNWGWRWIFYINLPVAALALLTVFYALPTVRTEDKIQLDWQGTLALVAGLVPLLLGFTWAGNAYPWVSPVILSLFGAGIAFLALFYWIERHAAEPIIAPELFKNQIFTSTALVALFVMMALFSAVMFLPLFVQGVLGKSAQQSGEILMPMMLSFVVSSIIGGQLISRTGKYKVQAVVGTLALTVGAFLLTLMGPDTSTLNVVFNVILLGIGIGVVLPLLNVAVQNAFPYKMMGMVSATQQFVRSLGGIIVAPVLGMVLVTVFSAQLSMLMPASLQTAIQTLPAEQQELLLNPQGLINAESQAAIQSSFTQMGDNGTELYNQFITIIHQSLTAGASKLFLVSTVFAVLAFLSTFALKELDLKQDEFFKETQEQVSLLE
ncbi:MAG: MFS transporter [Anaerolineae bacterium]|nr:MFS transporter [Anaerolineae bacterium]